MLFAVAVCALLTATTLTVVILTDRGPQRSAAAAAVPATPMSPTPRPASSRANARAPLCLIGSWRTVDEVFNIRFYTDQPEMRFTGGGRLYEFRPDGTGTERMDNVVLTGTFRGNELRIVGNGAMEFTWTASGGTLTYLAWTRSSITWSYYDQRGLLSTQPFETKADVNAAYAYTCQGAQVTESNATGYRSIWERLGGGYG